jgi:hypothetical protein
MPRHKVYATPGDYFVLQLSVDCKAHVGASGNIDDEVAERGVVQAHWVMLIIWNDNNGMQALKGFVHSITSDCSEM